MAMQRIAIIGSSGSGKSTLALQIHEILGIPVYHLDQYNWLPGWQARPFEDFARAHNQLCMQEQWIIEGIYTRTFEERIKHADTIIFLDFSRIQCLWRILKRTFVYYNKQTPTSAHGCRERFDLSFLKYVWDFKKLYNNQILTLLYEKTSKKRVYIFNNKVIINDYINQLKINKS